MPTPTYIALSQKSIGGSQSVTFSNIPQTYKDLVITVAATTATNSFLIMELNANTTQTNYSYIFMTGFSASTDAGIGDTNATGGVGNIWTTQTTNILNVIDYSSTIKHKVTLCRTLIAISSKSSIYRWNQTAAVTSLKLTCSNAVFDSGATVTLYGILG